jgi:hypothetical protein
MRIRPPATLDTQLRRDARITHFECQVLALLSENARQHPADERAGDCAFANCRSAWALDSVPDAGRAKAGRISRASLDVRANRYPF